MSPGRRKGRSRRRVFQAERTVSAKTEARAGLTCSRNSKEASMPREK